MKVKIEPSELKGSIYAPPSKSYAHRLLICAALAEGESEVSGISKSEDMLATLDCMRALGANALADGDVVSVSGISRKCEANPELNCRESGSTLRFFLPIGLVFSEEIKLTGAERLIERGVGIYEDMLKGVTFEKTNDSITVKGRLTSGDYIMRGDVSSQFASGMLFSLPLLEGDSTLTVTEPVESRAYIDITVDALKTFGVEVEENPRNTFRIKGGQKYKAANVQVEGDWSNGAFLYGFNFTGADIDIKGLKADSIQGDKVCREMFEALKSPGAKIDISDCPDLGPVLFSAAAAGLGGTFTGIRRLRIKESDRAAVMAEELSKFGIVCDIEENVMTVRAGELKKPEIPLNGHNDHRIVMSMSVLAAITGGEIEGAQAVNKSWPDFFKETEKLGLKVTKE